MTDFYFNKISSRRNRYSIRSQNTWVPPVQVPGRVPVQEPVPVRVPVPVETRVARIIYSKNSLTKNARSDCYKK